jgi:diamine N-acetyltransferase
VIELRPVTPDTYQACVDLVVADDQIGFVAPNLKSLAQAYVWPGAVARLICRDDEPVGFVLFMAVDVDDPAAGQGIVRFMVDHRFQGQGIGRAALTKALEWCVQERQAPVIRLSVVPENTRARDLYRSAGFAENGEVEGGEVVMVWTR